MEFGQRRRRRNGDRRRAGCDVCGTWSRRRATDRPGVAVPAACLMLLHGRASPRLIPRRHTSIALRSRLIINNLISSTVCAHIEWHRCQISVLGPMKYWLRGAQGRLREERRRAMAATIATMAVRIGPTARLGGRSAHRPSIDIDISGLATPAVYRWYH